MPRQWQYEARGIHNHLRDHVQAVVNEAMGVEGQRREREAEALARRSVPRDPGQVRQVQLARTEVDGVPKIVAVPENFGGGTTLIDLSDDEIRERPKELPDGRAEGP